MDHNKLKQILKNDEGPKLDYKEELHLTTESDRRELAKDVIAIANTRGGRGYIIYGIRDKTKKLVGIDPGDFKEEQIQQIIYNRSDPPVSVAVNFVEMDGKLLAVLTIYRSNHKPHQMLHNGSFYVRRGSTTDVARRGEIASMLQENGLLTHETVIVKHASMEDLDFELLKQYFEKMNVVSDRPADLLLEAMGLIGEKGEQNGYCPTMGGLLLFGKAPAIYMPHAYIKMVCGEEVQLVQGNIFRMLDETATLLKAYITDAAYPLEALNEAVANALVHRDYLDTSRGISITITPKNIEISNPGALVSGNSIYKYIKENNPDRRNPWLYQRLLTLDPQKRLLKSSIGMSRIKKAFEAIGEVKFINIGAQNLFKVVLPRMV